MKFLAGGVTKPLGFKANGLCCGIKKSGKLDLVLITSDTPAVAAAVFTKNSIKAAPVIVSQKHVQNNKLQAVIANSGNANCFTGKTGLLYAEQTTELIGKALKIPKGNVFVASTGIIGEPLPMKKIQKAINRLVKGLSKKGYHKVAKGILTTDTKPKECALQIVLGSKKIKIGGCSKGAGMIAPNMATMLGFITTDAAISATMLKKALKTAVEHSFNCISVDGCMSTNDTVVLMANGHAENTMIVKAGKDFDKFQNGLNEICLDLAKKIVLDGEGATKFLEIHICGAKTKPQAKTAAMAIADSVLVKTAAFGHNPNWGRIAAAVGSLGIKKVTEKSLKIKFSSFKKKNIQLNIDLGLGRHCATVYASDLSYNYVKINAEYN